jgi:hypothetical protein
MNKNKFNFSGVLALVIGILILVAVVPINIIFNYFDKSIDTTPSKMYSLTDITKNILEENSDKTIEIYFMCDLDDIRDYTEDLPLYQTLSQIKEYDNIEFYDFYPDEQPDVVESLNPDDLLEISTGDIIVKCGDTIKKIDLSKIFPYNSTTELYDYAGEELLAGALTIVTGGSLPTIYFMTGHGEPSIEGDYSTFSDILRTDNYDVKELDLTSTPEIPDDAAIVVLAGPESDITDDEKDILLDFAEDGGSMAFFIPPLDSDRLTNIEEVLAAFELGIDYNIVKETNSDFILYNADYESDPYVFNVDYPEFTDSFTVDLTTAINSLIEDGGTVGGISNTRSVYRIGESLTEYLEKSSIIVNESDDDGVYYTQSIPYGGDDESEAEAEELSEIELEFGYYSYNKLNGSKMILLGTDDVLNSSKVSVSIATSQQLVLNSIVWLYNSDIDMQIGNKAASYDHLTFDSSTAASSVMRIFVIVPICIAAIGLIVWLKRRHS